MNVPFSDVTSYVKPFPMTTWKLNPYCLSSDSLIRRAAPSMFKPAAPENLSMEPVMMSFISVCVSPEASEDLIVAFCMSFFNSEGVNLWAAMALVYFEGSYPRGQPMRRVYATLAVLKALIESVLSQ